MRINRRSCLNQLSLVFAVGTGWSVARAADQPSRPAPLEFRLAEERPAEGLVEAAVPGMDDKIYLRPTAELTQVDVADVKAARDERDSPQVELVFTAQGGAKMRKLTSSNNGKRLAILVGGKVVTAPTIRSTIGDRAVITGRFSPAEVEQMVRTIQGK